MAEFITTSSEYQVARLVALGQCEKQIADALCISPDTVRNHKASIRYKNKLKNSVDIAREFILSLENPKQYFSALLFLILQISIVTYFHKQDVRRVPKNVKEARFSPLLKIIKKDTLHL